jgi:hypothetical protein
MRHFILASSVALCLTTLSAPAPATDMLTPDQVNAWHGEERPDSLGPVMADLRWDSVYRWLTYRFDSPYTIGPDDQIIRPSRTQGEQ